MLPFVFAALMQSPTIDAFTADHPDILVEQCGRQLIADMDYDLGRQVLYVQDTETNEIIYSEDVADGSDADDYVDTLNICQIPG